MATIDEESQNSILGLMILNQDVTTQGLIAAKRGIYYSRLFEKPTRHAWYQIDFASNEITANGAANTSAGYIICNKGTALAVSLADGTVIGETKFFSNKGAGDATITPANLAGGTSVTIEQFEAVSFIWDGANWYIYANYSGTLNP